jgi:hypothetical protein
VTPNPSFEARPNIKTQAPQGGARYHPPCGAWVLLLASASIQTLGCTWPHRHPASTRLAQVGSPWPLPLVYRRLWQRAENARRLAWPGSPAEAVSKRQEQVNFAFAFRERRCGITRSVAASQVVSGFCQQSSKGFSRFQSMWSGQNSGCRLTLHSRGGPTACHQAWATAGGRPFSVAQAWRPTVGLPLSSNVRLHKGRVLASYRFSHDR